LPAANIPGASAENLRPNERDILLGDVLAAFRRRAEEISPLLAFAQSTQRRRVLPSTKLLVTGEAR
jgi:hypothetical protein